MYETMPYIGFRNYWKKFCPETSRLFARKLWSQYIEIAQASPDIAKKEEMSDIKGMKATMMSFDECCAMNVNYFASTPPQVACTQAPMPCQKPKGNNPMYVDNDKHIESSKINYLNDRASNIYFRKESEMHKTFGLVDDMKPQTAAEFVKRIQDGKFVLNDETKNKNTYDADRYIQWRDPAVKADKEGFAAALKVLEGVFQETRDAVAIGTPAEGLAAVKALDAWTPVMGNA